MAQSAGGFVALDDLVGQPDNRGCFLLQLGHSATLGALCAHLSRRHAAGARAGRPLVVVAQPPDRSLWREVGFRLGMSPLPGDIEAAGQQLAGVIAERGAMVVGCLAPRSTWDESVAEVIVRQLGRGERGGLVLLAVGPSEPVPAGWGGAVFEVETSASEEGLVRWWSALCAEGMQRSRRLGVAASFEQLERGWGQAVAVATAADATGEGERREVQALRALPADDARLVRRLQLAGRPWPLLSLGALGVKAGGAGNPVQRLIDAGLLHLGEGSLVRAADGLGGASGGAGDEAGLVARALCAVFPGDPWGQARAARLLLTSGQLDEAEAAHVRAIRLADDVLASADLWASWGDAVATLGDDDRYGCYLRGAELALLRGDADGAQGWAERAVALRPSAFRSLQAVGRASLGRSDLVAADVALTRSLAAAGDPDERAQALAGRAEVRYAQGRLAEAAALADEALSLSPGVAATLAARNTLGKLLLAHGQWSQAEEHFTADAGLAMQLDDSTAQLRARLNRAIAVMSEGRLHEARPMLEGVLVDGEQRGDERAVAFALSNLAVLAMNRHDYGEALLLSERAIGIRRRMGERLGLARVIANLAELRLRLGLVDEAEQALSFGRLAVSRGTTLPRTAHFSLIAARIHLARGQTLPAARELATALAGAAGSSDGDMLSECHRVGVRVALEDGDIERARHELEQAEQHSTASCAQAELELLRAQLQQAAGQPSLGAAQQAATLARRAGDEEFMREAHTLVARIALRDGQGELSRSHLNQALALRDRVLAGLSERLQRSFLARRDLAPLAQLERDLQAPASVPPPAASEGPRSEPRSLVAARPLSGEDPAIRGLLDAVRKVGRTDATVLVLGESGTGKELVAEALHESSPRREAPLVKVNCGALVESLLLSELFGHEKGSFTGATARKRGRFEMAEGGTLFLDEIGDISPATQVALLRVLQERTFERVGGTTPLRANVRIVAATHRDLRAMVERGEFRQDLYFRLSGITLHVPALRARLGDLPILTAHLLRRIADERGETPRTLSVEAMALLARHRWPGNVRELENALRAASLFADGAVIEASDLCEHIEALRGLAPRAEVVPASLRLVAPPPASLPAPPPSVGSGGPIDALDGGDDEGGEGELSGEASGATETIYAELKAGKFGLFDLKRQLERDCIARALAETRGNITRAAAILGMKRPRLSQLVKQYGLAAVSSEGT